MLINKLNEDVDKNGNLIGYGAKIGRNKTIVFGAYNAKSGFYSVLDVSNQGVQGSSQVCFKTLDEFEDFKSKYGNHIELVVKRLGPELNELVQVSTQYGNLWMRPGWFKNKPPVDARKLNKAVKQITDSISSRYDIEPTMRNACDNILYNNYLKNSTEDINEVLFNEYNIEITSVGITSNFTFDKICLKVVCDFPEDITEDGFYELAEEIEKSFALDVYKKYGGYKLLNAIYYFDITKLQKLRDKIKDKLINEIDNTQHLVDDPEVWEIAKDQIIEQIK